MFICDGSLPPHRLASDMEKDAMALLQAAELLGISSDDCAGVMLLAGTLAHHATYRRTMPGLDREHVSTELGAMLRMCDYAADEVLDEIQDGQGQLAELQEYLFTVEGDQD